MKFTVTKRGDYYYVVSDDGSIEYGQAYERIQDAMKRCKDINRRKATA